MTFEVPALLADNAREWFGAKGDRWVVELPSVVDRLVRQWGLQLVATLRSNTSLVCTTTGDRGLPLVLKVPMRDVDFAYAHANLRRFEHAALRHWRGDGCVELVEVDHQSGAMLLEACVPGDRLGDVVADEDADAIAADLLERLWRPPPASHPFPTTCDIARAWARRADAPIDPTLVDTMRDLVARLAVPPRDPVLLHGDLHHNNVLAATREPWLAIDPLPLVGGREYDAVMYLLLRKARLAAPETEWDGAITSFCRRLRLDEQRVREWTFVRIVSDAAATFTLGTSIAELEAPHEDLWSARLLLASVR